MDSILTQNNSVRACQQIYSELIKKEWLFDTTLPFSDLGAGILLENRYGNCNDRCDLFVYSLRSVGIPCGIDLIIQSPEKINPSHSWNYMIDEKGRCIDFALIDMFPDTIKQIPHFKRGKVYRKCFSRQRFPDIIRKNILLNVDNPNLKDVSADYFPDERIDIPMENTKDIIFLNVFNNKDWIPVSWSTVKNQKASFQHLEPDIIYMLTRYNNGKHHNQYIPFLYKGLGIYHFLWADTTRLHTIKINRKYPGSDRLDLFRQRLHGGTFQGANKSDFSDAETLYTIEEIPELIYHEIPVNNDNRFRFFRYKSGKEGHCDMAEIEFVSKEDNKPVKGKLIGIGTSFWNDPNIVMEALFDGDPLTYFSAHEPNDAWVGLDAMEPMKISKIRYLGRNDDNGIRLGDEYELFYFSENGWLSLGKQTGGYEALQYENVPTGALLWLRNLTRGKEERIFTYENDKQLWW